MKILITGANGQLGKACQSEFQHHTHLATDRNTLDITNREQCHSVLHDYKPDVVIHCAAWTDVRRAESAQKECYEVSLQGTYNLALVAKELDCIFVHLSTDYVFGGEKDTPYIEDDLVNPLNVYGRSKLAAELVVGDLLKKYYIVRTQWIFGDGKNFVRTILNTAEKVTEFSVVNDQIGSPTYAVDLAHWIHDLLRKEVAFGLYHAANTGEVSWADYTKEILRLKGKSQAVHYITTREYQDRFKDHTPKPAYSVLSTDKIAQYTTLRSWQLALAEYLLDI